MTTPYGKAVRKLRVDAGLKMKDMADDLGVKSAYLSAVEAGRKRITEKLLEQTISYFEALPEYEEGQIRNQLAPLVSQSQPDCTISLKGKADDDRELVAAFARRFSDLSVDQKDELKSLLNME